MNINAITILITKDDKILAVSRKYDHNDFNLPGGKVEEFETAEEAAIRELKEETGLILKNPKLIFTRDCPAGSDGLSYQVATFIGNISGNINTLEEGRVAWISKEKLFSGCFGIYNRQLLESLGI